MSTYSVMQTRIASDLARTDLTASIQQSIQSAIVYYSKERFWFNEEVSDFPLSASQEYYNSTSHSVPDFVDIDNAVLVLNGVTTGLRRETQVWMDDAYSTNANRPTHYCVYKNNIRVHPLPNTATYSFRLSYLKRFVTLSADGDTNAWMVEGEELIRSRAEFDLVSRLLRDNTWASFLKQAELDALTNLRLETATKLHSGRLTPTPF